MFAMKRIGLVVFAVMALSRPMFAAEARRTILSEKSYWRAFVMRGQGVLPR